MATRVEIYMLTKTIKNLMKGVKKINITRTAKELGRDRGTIRNIVNKINENPNFEPTRERSKPKEKQIENLKDLIIEKLAQNMWINSIYDLLLDEYKVKFSLSYLTQYIRKNNLKRYCIKHDNSGVMTHETPPAIEAQVDWKESQKMTLKNGEKIEFNIFVMKLSYSRKVKFILTLDRTQNTVFKCMTQTLRDFGFVPKRILFDNMKTVVYYPRNEGDKKQYEINSRFQMFADDIGFKVVPCLVGHPEQKGKVEAANKYLKHLEVWNNELETIEDLTKKVQDLEDKYNNKINRATGSIPNDSYYLELKKSTKFIKESFDFTKYFSENTKFETRKVDSMGFITYQNNYYSVPFNYKNKWVYVNLVDNYLMIEDDFKIITIHKIILNKKFKRSHHEEHMILSLTLGEKTNYKERLEQIVKSNLETLKLHLESKGKK